MAETQAERTDARDTAHSLNSLVEAAARLKISRDTLLRLIKNGEIRVVRISRRVLIGEAELRRIVRCGCGSAKAATRANRARRLRSE
jgi:excisionase family DNA binding protein